MPAVVVSHDRDLLADREVTGRDGLAGIPDPGRAVDRVGGREAVGAPDLDQVELALVTWPRWTSTTAVPF
jgi:hypothetical protein